MRYSSFCIKVKVFGTISKEESFSMLEINFEIELSMISFFFPLSFLYFLYLNHMYNIICTDVHTNEGNNRYRLSNSGTVFYLSFVLIFRRPYRNIH